MKSMNVYLLVFFVLCFEKWYMVRSLPTMSQYELEKQLKLINKPPVKSFQTENGDIWDCIPIDKQLAFDHPQLKNHSIQMKPSKNIVKFGKPSSRQEAIRFFPKKIRCPKGTVLIKRARIEEISSPSMPKFANTEANIPAGYQVAAIEMVTPNVGVHGDLNMWDAPAVQSDQYTSASIFVRNQNGNSIKAGWFVYPSAFGNYSRLLTYWTIDDGKSTGCYNILCPGFVQVSQTTAIGCTIYPSSIYDGQQYEFGLTIVQDDITGNWWLQYFDDNVGYYPNELFTSLRGGASQGGWGGETYSPILESYPPMGSGHFPNEGFGKAAFIGNMKLLDHSHQPVYPTPWKLVPTVTMERCYTLLYIGDRYRNLDYTMYYGGPPNCTVW